MAFSAKVGGLGAWATALNTDTQSGIRFNSRSASLTAIMRSAWSTKWASFPAKVKQSVWNPKFSKKLL
ncbi:hypothetical protein ACJZ2D_004057 [Fusarium nematophilum]